MVGPPLGGPHVHHAPSTRTLLAGMNLSPVRSFVSKNSGHGKGIIDLSKDALEDTAPTLLPSTVSPHRSPRLAARYRAGLLQRLNNPTGKGSASLGFAWFRLAKACQPPPKRRQSLDPARRGGKPKTWAGERLGAGRHRTNFLFCSSTEDDRCRFNAATASRAHK